MLEYVSYDKKIFLAEKDIFIDHGDLYEVPVWDYARHMLFLGLLLVSL